MPKKYCPKGHLYDPSIYGDQCPMCATAGVGQQPSMGAQPGHLATNIAGVNNYNAYNSNDEGHTRIAGGSNGANAPMDFPSYGAPKPGVEGETRVKPNVAAAKPAQPRQQQAPAHTVIRSAAAAKGAAAGAPNQRRLVGFLVTYNRNPMGKAYSIYEGRNFIGRDASCDISIPEDSQMSSKHLSILYRAADDKFKFRDEQSSNGTYINKELIDDGELQNYDIIRAGSTIFIFMAIPKIG